MTAEPQLHSHPLSHSWPCAVHATTAPAACPSSIVFAVDDNVYSIPLSVISNRPDFDIGGRGYVIITRQAIVVAENEQRAAQCLRLRDHRTRACDQSCAVDDELKRLLQQHPA